MSQFIETLKRAAANPVLIRDPYEGSKLLRLLRDLAVEGASMGVKPQEVPTLLAMLLDGKVVEPVPDRPVLYRLGPEGRRLLAIHGADPIGRPLRRQRVRNATIRRG